MSNEYVPKPSSSRFYIPSTLVSDFSNFLNNDIPGAVMDFNLITDWYEQKSPDYKAHVIRGEIYPDSTKSRYSNTDNNLNFRADYNSGIKKGDMIVDQNGTTYLLDWDVPYEPNNAMSRALRCNAKLKFERFQNEEVDKDGFLIHDSGWITIADSIPCNAYRHDGRLEFSVHSSFPGVVPNSITLISIQFNDSTKNIRVNDTFKWGNEGYVIADINLVGVNLEQTSGVIQIQAKKKAGTIDE